MSVAIFGKNSIILPIPVQFVCLGSLSLTHIKLEVDGRNGETLLGPYNKLSRYELFSSFQNNSDSKNNPYSMLTPIANKRQPSCEARQFN